jgi:hypothetical protein
MFNDRRKAAAAKKTAYKAGAIARKGMAPDESSYKVSPNVTVIPGKDKAPLVTSQGKGNNLNGAGQARIQNARSESAPSKSEAKANKRGLKAANSGKMMSDRKAVKTGRPQGNTERSAVREEVKKSGSWDTRAERYSNAASLVESRKKNGANLYDGGKKPTGALNDPKYAPKGKRK